MGYKCLMGTGLFELVLDESERKQGLDLLMAHYGARGPQEYLPQVLEKTAVLRLKADSVSCKERK